ncbi:MAG: DUF2190 family protein [Candidatus Bathyarchaeia archaeon]|nr:DUF2190 family protein [Candidatus Bathyarchaeota archaeon]
MADFSGKTGMAIGETDDPNAVIERFTAGAAITKGDPVYLSADDTVSPATSAQDCIGIAVKSVASGEQCPVLVRGRVKVAVGGAVTRGKAVYGADSSKRVMALADINEGGSSTISWTRKLGWALETASAAGDLIFIFVEK